MKPKALHHIKRIDDSSRSTYAWLVQVQRHYQKSVKMFSDSLWGGKRKALAQARAWRDAHMQPHSEYTHALWRRNQLRSNNRSGLVGVARYERKPTASKKDGKGAYWLASWIDENGVGKKRKYAVSLWGEHGAQQKAVAQRELQVRRTVAAKTSKHF